MMKKKHLRRESQQKDRNIKIQRFKTKKLIPQMYSHHIIPQRTEYESDHHGSGIRDLRGNQIANYTTLMNRYRNTRVKEHSEYLTQESIALLKERLKSVQQSYEILIAEERHKNQEKTEVILQVIQQLQLTHNQKIMALKNLILDNHGQKKDVDFVDDKMHQIKSNIDDLIQQSNTFKQKNHEAQKKIAAKRKNIRQRQQQLDQINSQLLEVRGELESFELNNLKKNKINREIIEIFKEADSLKAL